MNEKQKNFINIQLFGQDFPPLYGEEEIMEKIEEILTIDEKINELFIEREMKVENLKKAIAEKNKAKN